MKIKQGANIQGLHPKMRTVLITAAVVWEENGQELVVTSGLDGEHSAGSAHYYGCAVDLRTRYFGDAELAVIYRELRERLDRVEYYVKLESNHIHAHYRHPDWRQ